MSSTPGAPRGAFTLAPGDGPGILMSAGIGLTPVLAMLEALVAGGSRRDVWWIDGPRNRAEHAFSAEARSLLRSLPGGHSRILYSAPGPTDRLAVDFDAAGRMDAHVLQELGAPREADFYLCGPPAFMSSLIADLARWGVAAERLHSENFGSGPRRPGRGRQSVTCAASTRSTRLRRPWCLSREAIWRCPGILRFESLLELAEGLRRAGALGLSHWRVPQLRDRSYRWRGRLFRRAAHAASESICRFAAAGRAPTLCWICNARSATPPVQAPFRVRNHGRASA